MGSAQGPHFARTHLALAAISTAAALAGVVVALVATDTIQISRPSSAPAEAEVQAPRTVTQTVTETVTAPAPEPVAVVGPCDQEPNEDLMSAVPIALKPCDAAIETENDRDWYAFESPTGGQFELVVQKAQTKEEFGSIIATVYVDGDLVEDEHVTADEPFKLRYTLEPGSEFAVEVIDGCSPGGCGVGPYAVQLEQLS